jgi:H+/Cl- antiporter ClcA
MTPRPAAAIRIGAMTDEALTVQEADAVIASPRFLVLMAVAAVVGLLVSFAAWLFLEGTFRLQRLLLVDVPDHLGGQPPLWYLLVVLGTGGLLAGLAIARLPGHGGHVPVDGLGSGGAPPAGLTLLGVVLAGAATIGCGLVLGPEAPLIALGSGLGALAARSGRRPSPPEAVTVLAAAGSFAAVSFIFASPIIAAVLLIEATALGGARQRLILLPGLMAAGIGSLVSIGIGSLSGLSDADYALGTLDLPSFAQPSVADLAWAPALAVVVTLAVEAIRRGGRATARRAAQRPVALAVAAGLVVAVAAWGFGAATDEDPVAVLLSGQAQLPGLVAHAPSWSVGTLVLLIALKGAGYAVCLGAVRGGPTFPAVFLGAAAGLLADRLPGLSTTPAVAVCLAAATVTILGLPLSSVLIAILLTAQAGVGAAPLAIVAVIAAHVTTVVVRGRRQRLPVSSPSPS